ncbi:hypothetical protein CPAS15_0032 [Clostridium phage CPAS-15]|nr:hypothetical protein CPAS15_0032 [Clostridium phage CPAS-15]
MVLGVITLVSIFLLGVFIGFEVKKWN